MVKAITLIAVGAVLGAVVVGILPSSGDAGGQTNPATTTANFARLPATEESESSGDSDLANLNIGDLSAITDPAARRNAALALLNEHEHSAASLDEISEALPPIEVVSFRIEAIALLGEQDAPGALAAAVSLADPEQRRLAFGRLAQSLAEHDPFGAVSNLNVINSAALESEFIGALLASWAIIDPDQALAYLESSADVRIPVSELAFDLLGDHDPERLLSLADELAGDVRTEAIAAAFETFIERDPLAALGRVGQLAAGSDRSRLEDEVLRGYGKQYPDEAWRWANETSAEADTRVLVLAGILSVDPARALDLVITDLTSADTDRRAQMRQRVGTYLHYLHESATSDEIVFALDRILSLDSSLEANVQQFLSTWANEDPEAVLDWSLQNLDRLSQGRALSSIGSSLARENPERVREALFRFPAADRAAWVTGVGRTLAANDLDAAREWAFEFPRGPLRDAALHEYVSSEAYGGSVDAQLFGQFSSNVARDQAASEVSFRLACDGHTALAREIASTHIADQALLAQSEQRIEQDPRGTIQCRLRR